MIDNYEMIVESCFITVRWFTRTKMTNECYMKCATAFDARDYPQSL